MTDLIERLRDVATAGGLREQAADEIERLKSTMRDTESETVARLRAALEKAHDHLMNLQPHIAQTPERHQPFIDTHVDLAMEVMSEALK